ncbi:50S ribosomal protein L18 [Fulvivirga sp. M361]|uniref:50S ribosomal protein L18 n=1 Tax=Fulvivirga sp. M361 TaxID=2594266 RepID=UPI001179BAB8|nr:50S ribosomal protein L18 [Fulvivirga sp. M361]TRX53757.1 50S ribosomal protein L18 [Fulvivirga sp. M361]
MAFNKYKRRLRIKRSVRSKVSGTTEKPRLSVFKSNKAIYAQIIDDTNGHTMTSVSSSEMGNQGINMEVSKGVGKKLAEKALASGIERIVFDRNGYIYHGKIKALAEGAREGGLKF